MHAPRCIGEGAGGGGVVEGGFVGDDYGIRTGLKQGSFATIVLYSRDFPRQWRRIDRWYNDRFGMEGGEKEVLFGRSRGFLIFLRSASILFYFVKSVTRFPDFFVGRIEISE